MRRRNLLFLIPLLLIPLSFAKNKAKTPLPKLVAHAQYVMVTTYFGDPAKHPLDARITVEDRQAVSDVQDALEKWGRYSIAYRSEDAELILVVRKGRLMDVEAGARIHAGSRQPCTPAQDPGIPCTREENPGVDPVANVDVGDPQDELVLYQSEPDSTPLWRGRSVDGLKAPQMKLVAELRAKVDETAKAP